MTDAPFGTSETVMWRMQKVERELEDVRALQARQYEELSKKLDRITWALVTTCITITVAMIVFVIQTGTPGG